MSPALAAIAQKLSVFRLKGRPDKVCPSCLAPGSRNAVTPSDPFKSVVIIPLEDVVIPSDRKLNAVKRKGVEEPAFE